ncbi:uncharacterized protein LOC114284802 [Camellia sinensis]|uniref:uncharacterized protein LOC114284802 n=1 Tax=Camellia sinensis TaxID=4442 RepID=UPI001036EA20|nr:uncharacterized protein LOC114284802 [Camellia sinensis]
MGVQHIEVVVELKSEVGQSSSSGSLRVGGGDEMDALHRFCHHKEKKLLSAPWADGRYKGQLLAVMVKNGNNGLFPVAFAIVDSKTTTNWSWFLHKLGKVVDTRRQITFISDHNIGLLEAMPKVFPSAHHGYYLQRLKNNLRDWTKGVGQENSFQLLCNVVIFCRGMRYEKMTSNAAKSFNNWIKKSRNLLITRTVDIIHTQLIRKMLARQDQENKWNEVVCPTFETMLLDSFNDSRSWQINGFPCDHAVIAIQKNRYNLSDCVEHYFHVETYHAAYSGAIFHIPLVEKPPFDPTDLTIYPPTVKRPPGRPKKNKIPSRGEKLKQIRCGRYDKLGSHNRKSCKEPI